MFFFLHDSIFRKDSEFHRKERIVMKREVDTSFAKEEEKEKEKEKEKEYVSIYCDDDE